MNWDALGAIGEIVGAGGVIVSLLYLAGQVRGSSRQARHDAAQSVIAKLNGLTSNKRFRRLHRNRTDMRKLANIEWTVGVVTTVLVCSPFPASAQTSGLRDPLLDRLIGDWVLEGEMAGGQVTHDVEFERVLGGQYLRLHEVARERDATGAPAYEAIVFIGWDAESKRLACLWLDSTGGEGLTNGVIGYAVPADDSIPFHFRFPDGSPFHTTFVYDRRTDTWEWHMDGEEDGVRRPFARVRMSRK